MTKGFWEKLPRPFFALAPMANVTDAAFRRMFVKHGRPDVFWTEFVSCEGLCSRPLRLAEHGGRASGPPESLLADLAFTRAEHPIVAQLFGADPGHMEQCAALVAKLGFDGVDINMGCPDRAVERQGAGAALMKDPKRAAELVRAAERGAGDIPVSVKTRIGYRTNELKAWLPALCAAGPAAITIHARTRAEMSKVPARWDTVAEAVRIVRKCAPRGARPLIIGNGDVRDLAEARRRARETGADGIMLGRAAFGNPWLFSRRRKPPSVAERLDALVEHTRLFERLFRGIKSFAVMKKHYAAYVTGFPGARELRAELMGAKDADAVARIVEKHYAKK